PRLPTRERERALERPRYPERVERRRDPLRAPEPTVADRAQPLHENGRGRIHAESHDMECRAAPGDRDLDAGHEPDSRGVRRAGGLLEAVDRIVVRERDRIDAGTRGELDQLG